MRHRNLIPIYAILILIMSICHSRSQNLLEYITTNLRRRLVGSNCVVVETGIITPRAYCDGCLIEEATACVTDMRLNKTGSVPYSCNMNKLMQSYEPQCCPARDEIGRLVKASSAYPFAFTCLQFVGCMNSLVASSLMQECQTVCSREPQVCAPYPIPKVEVVICFLGSETVELRSGAIKSLEDVQVGDEVLSADSQGQMAYSTVISVPHLRNDHPALFHRLSLFSGADIHMTADHLIPVGNCRSTFSEYQLSAAAKVAVGSCVWTVTGSDRVENNEVVQGKGIYSVVTELPFVVVSNVVASPFAINHVAGDSFYELYRLGYRLFPQVFRSDLFIHLHSKFSDAITSFSSFVMIS